jgi:hypothetical protein
MNARAGRGGGPLNVQVKIDVDRATDAFRRARRDINSQVRRALLAAAEHDALPAGRRAAPTFAVPYLIARATSRSAYISARGPRWVGRALGLLEFGGTVRTELQPKTAQALSLGPDLVRARVTGPRRYHPQLRLTKAVESRRPQIEESILEEVIKVFGPPLERDA